MSHFNFQFEELQRRNAVTSMADQEESPSGAAIAATLGVRVIQSVVFLYDFLTYPIYYAVSESSKIIS